MQDAKENLTKEELIEKINSERQTFKMALEARDEDKRRAIAQVRHLADLVIARILQSYGEQTGDEYVLDIPRPKEIEGKAWVTRVETPDDDTYRLRAKLIEIPEVK